MPQPRNTRAQDQTPETPQGTATPQADTAPATQQADPQVAYAETLLTDADNLANERTRLFERIGANRDLLRSMVKTGKLSDDQVARIEKHYPKRERKARENGNGATDAPAEQPAADQPAAA